MATITRPISHSIISTANWGIPITDQVNALTTAMNGLKPTFSQATTGQTLTTTSTLTGSVINVPANTTVLLIAGIYFDLSAGTGTGFTNIVVEVRVNGTVGPVSYSLFSGAFTSGAVSGTPCIAMQRFTTAGTLQVSLRTGAGPVHTVAVRGVANGGLIVLEMKDV